MFNTRVTNHVQVVREAIYDAFYRLTNPKSQITAYVFDVVRAIVPKSNLDDVFITKEEVMTHPDSYIPLPFHFTREDNRTASTTVAWNLPNPLLRDKACSITFKSECTEMPPQLQALEKTPRILQAKPWNNPDIFPPVDQFKGRWQGEPVLYR